VSFDQNDPRWQDFLSAARQYIETIDAPSPADLEQICAKLHGDLLELQLAAIDLPETEVDGSDPAMVTEAKRADRGKLKENFPIRYSMPDQVLEISGETPVIREMSDDLADIYDELQDLLALDEAGYIDDTVWQARSGYIEDWGFLAVSVQAALWKYVAEAAIDADNAATPEP
jgi:hypothetical protein